MSYSGVKHWVRMLKEGRTQVEDEPCAGHPVTSVNKETVSTVCLLLQEDRPYTLTNIHHEIAAQYPYIAASRTYIDSIITEPIEMCKLCTRWIPRQLTDDMK